MSAEPDSDTAIVRVVLARPDGDVDVAWMMGGTTLQVRRFRAHLGHVVEVIGTEQRLWRVGAGLRHSVCSLEVDAALDVVVSRALDVAQPAGLDATSCAPMNGTPAPAACADLAEPVGAKAEAPASRGWLPRWVAEQLQKRRFALPFTGHRRQTEAVELLLHQPTQLGDIAIARCARGGYCVVWQGQLIGCFPDQQTAIDKASIGDVTRPTGRTDIASLGISAARAAWLPYPSDTRIDVTRRA